MSYDVLHPRDVTAGGTITTSSVRFRGAHLAATAASSVVLFAGTTNTTAALSTSATRVVIGALTNTSPDLWLNASDTLLCPGGLAVSIDTGNIYHLTVYTQG